MIVDPVQLENCVAVLKADSVAAGSVTHLSCLNILKIKLFLSVHFDRAELKVVVKEEPFENLPKFLRYL